MVGKKMGITGKGRCNITNSADMAEFIKNTPGNGKFLYGAYERFSNEDLLDLLHSWGLKTKVERGGRVFPESDSALEVRNIFMKILKKYNVQVHLNEPVTSITVQENRVVGVTTDKEQYACDAAIICTGGASYPLTGSTGDGYVLAEKVGHTITDIRPSLVPIVTNETWVKEIMGLSLRLSLIHIFLTNAWHIWRIWDHYDSNISTLDAIKLVYNASKINKEEIHFYILPGEKELIGETTYWKVNPTEAQRLVGITMGNLPANEMTQFISAPTNSTSKVAPESEHNGGTITKPTEPGEESGSKR